MEKPEKTRRLAAILCSDVVGFSSRMAEDEAGTLVALNQLNDEVINPQVAQFDGRVFKRMGDGALAEFASAVNAVACALEIQKHLQRARGDGPLLRIGINLGDVVAQGGDMFGGGVNVAARLQALAPPGGIALSEAVFDNITGNVVAVFEDIGPQNLKNIKTPVRVYAWPEGQNAEGPARMQAGTGLPLVGRPTLIVLPFVNRSGNPEYDDFAAGITEDVIYGLSRVSGVDVIGRHTAFTYRGRQPSVAELRQELGVRYIVEGSVRRSDGATRISVELADSKKGLQIWCHQWDEPLNEIFETLDQIVTRIVAALPGQILRAEKDRVRGLTCDMTAYDHVIAGRLCHHRVERSMNRQALEHLDKAIELDGEYADAYAWKACVLGQQLQFGFSEDIEAVEAVAMEMLTRALELDSEHLECHRLMSEVSMIMDQIDMAAEHNATALSINPVDPRLLAQKGEVLTWQGRAEEGLVWIEKAMTLDPFGAPDRAHLLGIACYAAGRYQDAAKAYSMIRAPRDGPLAEAAAARTQMGDAANAAELVGAALKINPDFSLRTHAATRHFKSDNDRAHLEQGMRNAGLPE